MVHGVLETVVGALRWYGLGLLISLPAVPVFFAWLPPSVAWGVSRCLGPQLVCWAALLPAVIWAPLPFTPARVVLAAVVLGFLATAANKAFRAFLTDKKNDRREWRREIFRFEAFFLSAFLVLAALVNWCTTLSTNDGMLDASLFGAILNQRTFPIEDPGLAGVPLHYYVFGFYSKAVVALFTGLSVLENYRIAVAATTTAQLAALILFLRAFEWTFRRSIIAALVLGLSSNFESFAALVRKLLWGGSYNTGQVVGWFADDYASGGFLISGFFGGVLHSTILSLSIQPIFYCLVALALFAPERERKKREWALAIVGGLMAAWATASDTWEVPMYLGLPMLILLATFRRRKPAETLALTLTQIGLCYLASRPFAPIAHPVAVQFGWDHEHSPLDAFFAHWGNFVLPLLAWTAARVWTTRRWIYAVPVYLVGIALCLNDAYWLIGAMLVLSAIEIETAEEKTRSLFLLIFASFGMLMVLELVYVRNTTPLRFNTLTHVNPIAWNLLQVVLAVLLVSQWPAMPVWLRRTTVGAAVILLFPYFLVFELKSRFHDFKTFDAQKGLGEVARQDPDDAKLVAWMIQEQKRRALPGVLLESSEDEYAATIPARLSSPAGMRSYLAYRGHAWHQILYDQSTEVPRRRAFLAALEDGSWEKGQQTSCAALVDLLRAERIDYVAIGFVERQRFHPSFQKTVARCLTPLQEVGRAALYDAHAMPLRSANNR